MTEFAGALHNFDNPDNSQRDVIERAQTARKCRLREEGGIILNAESGQPFTFGDTCVEYGPSVGYDPAATEAAQADVKVFLTELFHLH